MANLLVSKYRHLYYGNLVEKRSTYVNDVDQLAAIQISFLMAQKEHSVHGTLSGNELFMLQKRINSNKLVVSDSSNLCTPFNSANLDIVPFDEIYTSYISFIKHCNIIDNADVKLFLNSQNVLCEEKETIESNDQIEDGLVCYEKSLLSPVAIKTTQLSLQKHTPKNPRTLMQNFQSPQIPSATCSPFAQSPKNSSNLQLRRIIISYLQLIVNSRNEIALARIIDVPTRGIEHKSFTDIRKFSLKKGMPMYQVISSFARQVLLGGKGYAPNEHHALFQHKEGLLDFMELMDKLQTIVDEGESIGSVLTSLLKLLKTAFIRAKDPVFSPKTVSLVIQELMDIVKSQFLNIVKGSKLEMCLLLRDFVDFMSCIAGNEVTLNSSQLCGILSTPEISSTSFKKIATLVTNFTTPEVCEETPKKSKKQILCKSSGENLESIIETDEKQTPVSLKMNNKNNNDYDQDDNVDDITPLYGPVKLVRCPVSENQNDKGKMTNVLTKKTQSLVSMICNEEKVIKKECPPVKRRAVAPMEKKSKCAKKIKLLSGQKTLSQFFRK